MASRRSSNAAKRSKGGSRGAAARRSSAPIVDAAARNDIAGVLIVVVALALGLALASSSTAIVTSSVRMALQQGFGVGAMLVPIAILLFGLTFFVKSDLPISARSAIGLTLVVIAVLSLLSIGYPGVATDASAALREPALSHAGGYVGGGVAWTLVTLFGQPVGTVILIGVIVAGVIVCGFSISDLVAKVRARAEEAHEQMAVRREERASAKAEARAAHEAAEDLAAGATLAAPGRGRRSAKCAQASLLDENGEAQTTFIGDRQTSVLRRPGAQDAAATTVLPQDAAASGDEELDADAMPLPEEAATKILSGTTPSFLQRSGKADGSPADGDAKSKRKGRRASEPEKQGVAVAVATTPERPGDAVEDFKLPPLSMLETNPNSAGGAVSRAELSQVAQRLQSTLEEFGLTSKVTGWTSGPSVTTFKVSMGEGERVSKITNLQDDIALSLAARSVRIFSPIPGTSLVGIEIANPKTEPVLLGDVLPYVSGGPLAVAFGRDSEGNPVTEDLSELPHLLVAGTTGSGKSVFLNAIIMSILMRATPQQVRFIMVDPKHVEFTFYEGLPHLYVPVITDPHKAASALQWAVSEMDRRYKMFERYRVRNISAFNKAVERGDFADEERPPEKVPYFVIVIDELSDLMLVAGKDVESSIVRIAQLGRAAGIHLVVATQRPSADVVTGLIKANIDNRVALAVDNGMNSRIILDQNGAERLLGKGDMLYKIRGHRPRRAQSCFQTDAEIESVVSFLKDQVEPDYHDEILSAVAPTQASGAASADGASDDDPLVWDAAQLVVESQLGSTSALQRHLKVGYARAGRIMDMLEQKGVVGPPDGSKPREVLLDAKGLEELRAAESEYGEVR
jgi:S-DNA-T family DNA segregation ATPase FtsK/SpoIIIE